MGYGILEEHTLIYVLTLIWIVLVQGMIKKAQVVHVTFLEIVLFHGIARSKLWLRCQLFRLVLDVVKFCGYNIL